MLYHYENRSAHNIVPRRKVHPGYMGTRKKSPAETGAACTDCSDGCKRDAESRYRSRSGYQQANSPALAATLFGFSAWRAAKGCSSSWSFAQNHPQKDSGSCRSHSAYNPTQCNSLEYPQHGKGPGTQRGHDPADMETAQPQTPFDQNLQTQSRQTLRREALRCCWSLPQSSRQVTGLECRREESNPSARPISAWLTDEERALWNHDARLQTQRHDYFICSPQHARRQGDRRLYAAPSASGVYPFPQENRWRDSGRARPPFDRGQLRYSQTPTCEVLAQTASTVPFALYADIQFLVEPGRALVPRAYRQTHPSGHVPERARIDCCYQRLYRQPQSKSTGVCMECPCRTDFNQSRQK